MTERIVGLAGFLVAFMGLIWGLVFHTLGIILLLTGVIAMILGLIFMED